MAPSPKASKPVKKPVAAKAAVNKAAAKNTTTVAAKPVRKASITATSPATVRPVVVSSASPAVGTTSGPKPAYGFKAKPGTTERPNINLKDAPWVDNFKRFAAENPAMTLVGIVSVTLALILMLD